MAAVIAFDTLKYSKRLKDAGVLPAQAEAEVLEVNLKDLATKADLAREAEYLRRDIREMEQRIDARFVQLEQRMTIKLGGLMVVAVGVVAALVKLL